VKLVRTAAACAVGFSLLVVSHAGAAAKPKPKPACQVVSDVAGDGDGKDLNGTSPFPVGPVKSPASLPVTSGGPTVDALDITSADVVADKRNITAVIRVKKLVKTVPTAGPLGLRWAVGFTADDMPFTFMAHTDPTGAVTFDAAYIDPTFGGALYGGLLTGSFDLAKNEIHITAPTSLLAPQATIKPGARLTALNANTGGELNIPDKTGKLGGGGIEEQTLYFADTASSTKTFVVGTPSCVTPGH
jgi:hypothetical protein